MSECLYNSSSALRPLELLEGQGANEPMMTNRYLIGDIKIAAVHLVSALDTLP